MEKPNIFVTGAPADGFEAVKSLAHELPPSILVNGEYDMLHILGHAERYFQTGGGELSNNLLKVVRPELRVELRTALYSALQRNTNADAHGIKVKMDEGIETVHIHVRPVLQSNDAAHNFIWVLFEKSTSAETSKTSLLAANDSVAEQLQPELIYIKEQLRNTAGQHDLQAEELQSINEELTTVNEELKRKVEELSISNSNFQNLINSTYIATLFLDRSCKINMFTPAARDIFNLLPADIGRPLSDITHQLESEDLQKDAEVVLDKLKVIEREVRSKEGTFYLMRAQPYRTEEDLINGVVISFIDITERKAADEALRKSEQRFRALIDKGTDIITITNKEGIITYASPSIQAVTGYTVEEFTNHNPLTENEIHPEDLPRCQQVFEQLLAKWGESIFLQHRYLHKGGEWRWIEGTFTSLFHDPSINGIVANYRDITERKQAEEKLRSSEETYRIALEAGEMATWDWNIKTNTATWNEQHFRLFGKKHTTNNLTPEDFLSQVYEEDLPYVKKQLLEEAEKTNVYYAEFRIIREDNKSMRWMTGYGRVTERENGKINRLTGVMFDSTKQKAAEEELLSVQNSLNTALDAAKMGVWDWDLITGDTNRSPRHDQLLGYVSWQEGWNQEKAKQNIIEEDKPKFDEAFTHLLNTGVFQLEARVKHSDGSLCWINYFGRAFKNDESKFTYAAGVIFDITDRKTIEKQKDEFIGIASHELKTPVTSIKAYAEILHEMFTEANDNESANLMLKLDNQVNRLAKLIKDLLDVTKVSEGQLHLIEEQFSIEDLIKNTAEEMQRTTRNHTIRLTLSQLPTMKGDKERIGQVLTNLLSNSIKYSPFSKDILVEAKQEEGNILISVTDFGIGMSEGTVSRLFERFFRSDNPSVRSYPGLGLGLFISMEIMKRHKGSIKVQSEKEKGSTFTMILPVGH